MPPKMVQKHDKKPNGIWNEFWMDFGTILAPFWEPWGAPGLHFWSQNRTFGKDGHQNGAPWGLLGSKWSQNGAQMAAWAQKGAKMMPKWIPNGTQTVSKRLKNCENQTRLVSETRETTKPCRNNEPHRIHETPKLCP